jgi:hypothetical protein
MEKGFLLDRVQMDGTGISVNQAVIFPVTVLANPAKAPLSLRYTAILRTEFALNLTPLQWGEKGRELCFDETLLGNLRVRGPRKTYPLNS